jgi:hypothetical protein
MIRYGLVCKKGHEFEGWFRDSADYDGQAKRRLVECPVCGSKSVEKQIMAPSVARRDRGRSVPQEAPPESPPSAGEAAASASEPPSPLPAPVAAAALAAGVPPEAVAAMAVQRQMLTALRRARDEVLSKAENVGERFPEEARKIHYREAEARGIYGRATPEEAEALREEGIEFHPVPVLPDDFN